MGTLDNTHFPWVHGGILGSKGKINQLKNNCNFENNYLKVIYSIEQPNNLVTFDQSEKLIKKSKSVHIKYTNYVTLNTIRLVKFGPSGITVFGYLVVQIHLMNLPIFGFFLEIMTKVLKKIRIIWI